MLTGALMVVAALAAGLASLPGLGLPVALLMFTMGTLGLGNGAVFQVVPQRFPAAVRPMTGLVARPAGSAASCSPSPSARSKAPRAPSPPASSPSPPPP